MTHTAMEKAGLTKPGLFRKWEYEISRKEDTGFEWENR
jgi:hypothetical protein